MRQPCSLNGVEGLGFRDERYLQGLGFRVETDLQPALPTSTVLHLPRRHKKQRDRSILGMLTTQNRTPGPSILGFSHMRLRYLHHRALVCAPPRHIIHTHITSAPSTRLHASHPHPHLPLPLPALTPVLICPFPSPSPSAPSLPLPALTPVLTPLRASTFCSALDWPATHPSPTAPTPRTRDR